VTSQQQLILGILAATDQVVCLADAVANSVGIVSKEEEKNLRQEIEKIRILTETVRNQLRIHCSSTAAPLFFLYR
jgi:hypothetical protein